MDTEAKLYMGRAENELILAKTSFDISTKRELKETLGIPKEKTFFNNVISQAYYSIFYAAKAYLSSRGITTTAPEEHRKTYEEFKKFVDKGGLSRDLLNIYDAETEKAGILLKIFFREKRKRGMFTYNVQSEANIPYAQESLRNSKTFVSSIKPLFERQ
jgi:uncharacterized protein (UPF0332 family)